MKSKPSSLCRSFLWVALVLFYHPVFATHGDISAVEDGSSQSLWQSQQTEEQNTELETGEETEGSSQVAEGSITNKNLLRQKLENEKQANNNVYSLSQHQPNYFLPFSHVNGLNNLAIDGVDPEQIDNTEAKFQVSIKTPL